LIADVTVFNYKTEPFIARSGYLWLQKYVNYPGYFEASLLCFDGFWLTFAFKNVPGCPDETRFEWCKLILPLAKINGHFKTRYKWVDIATDFLLKDAAPFS
jgi:hypothetical protein